MPENQPKYCTTNRRATENASIWQHPSYSWSAIMVGWHIPCGLAHSQGESPIQHHHLLLGMFTNSMETHNQIMWQDVVETYDQGANILSATRSDTPPPHYPVVCGVKVGACLCDQSKPSITHALQNDFCFKRPLMLRGSIPLPLFTGIGSLSYSDIWL